MRFARRPWGWWLVLLSREHFKVKLLRFKRGGQLSMQRHQKRNELWLFLSGNGLMAYSSAPKAGDYKMIRCGRWHQYMAARPTWVLEVQYGETCKEADIERV